MRLVLSDRSKHVRGRDKGKWGQRGEERLVELRELLLAAESPIKLSALHDKLPCACEKIHKSAERKVLARHASILYTERASDTLVPTRI